jgi:hypothetical protein
VPRKTMSYRGATFTELDPGMPSTVPPVAWCCLPPAVDRTFPCETRKVIRAALCDMRDLTTTKRSWSLSWSVEVVAQNPGP